MLDSWRSVNTLKYSMAVGIILCPDASLALPLLIPGMEGISEDAQENTPCWNRLGDKESQRRVREKAHLRALHILIKKELRNR